MKDGPLINSLEGSRNDDVFGARQFFIFFFFFFQQGNLLDKRGMLATFKSKSLDLLGSSRISARLAAAAAAANLAGTDAAAVARNAERRRRLFRRHKKANSATGSYEDSAGSQSRSSSVESNQSGCGGGQQQQQGHAIHRGLESALKTSTLFAWSSVEHAAAVHQHAAMPASQPSFMESE